MATSWTRNAVWYAHSTCALGVHAWTKAQQTGWPVLWAASTTLTVVNVGALFSCFECNTAWMTGTLRTGVFIASAALARAQLQCSAVNTTCAQVAWNMQLLIHLAVHVVLWAIDLKLRDKTPTQGAPGDEWGWLRVHALALSVAAFVCLFNNTDPEGLPSNPALSSRSPNELNSLARQMLRPKRCRQCGFGPMDFAGCDDLQRHHHERVRNRSGGEGTARVSNACPHCGNMQRFMETAWAPWRDHAGVSSCCLVRLLAPLSVPALRFVCASSFAVAVDVLYVRHTAVACAGLVLSLCVLLWPRRQENAGNDEEGAARPETERPETAQPETTAQPREDDATDGSPDCGAATRAAQPRRVGYWTALGNALHARPARVFLDPGDVCTVCQDGFEPEAYVNTDSMTAGVRTTACATTACPLWCGHVVHRDCLWGLVKAAEGRHALCPQCRGTVTGTGATAPDATPTNFV